MFCFMVMMSPQMLVLWYFVGNSNTYCTYLLYLLTILNLFKCGHWIGLHDCMDFWICLSYLPYIVQCVFATQTHRHQAGCDINVHIHYDCNICIARGNSGRTRDMANGSHSFAILISSGINAIQLSVVHWSFLLIFNLVWTCMMLAELCWPALSMSVQRYYSRCVNRAHRR